MPNGKLVGDKPDSARGGELSLCDCTVSTNSDSPDRNFAARYISPDTSANRAVALWKSSNADISTFHIWSGIANFAAFGGIAPLRISGNG